MFNYTQHQQIKNTATAKGLELWTGNKVLTYFNLIILDDNDVSTYSVYYLSQILKITK